MEDKQNKKHGGGPKTPEGKARSARNALRHGLTGNSVVLPSEDPAKFQLLLEDHVREFDPDNTTQMDLVHEMAVCRWRLQRIATMETCMFEINMARTERASNAEFKNPDVDTRMTLAFMHMCETGRSFTNLRRYETAITRRSHQLLAELKTLKKDFPASDPPALPDGAAPSQIDGPKTDPMRPNQQDAPAPAPAAKDYETNSPSAQPPPGNYETNSAAAHQLAKDYETNSLPPRATASSKANPNSAKPCTIRQIAPPPAAITAAPAPASDSPVIPRVRVLRCP
jgi:hypothetical protein